MTFFSRAESKTRPVRFPVPKLLASVLLVLALIGCAEDAADLHDLSSSEIRSVSDRDLCEAYYYGQGANVRQELERRNLISEAYWPAVRKNVVRQGMRICSVRAAWGAAQRTVANTEADVDRTMIYERKGQRIDVLLVDGRVKRIERFEQSE